MANSDRFYVLPCYEKSTYKSIAKRFLDTFRAFQSKNVVYTTNRMTAKPRGVTDACQSGNSVSAAARYRYRSHILLDSFIINLYVTSTPRQSISTRTLDRRRVQHVIQIIIITVLFFRFFLPAIKTFCRFLPNCSTHLSWPVCVLCSRPFFFFFFYSIWISFYPVCPTPYSSRACFIRFIDQRYRLVRPFSSRRPCPLHSFWDVTFSDVRSSEDRSRRPNPSSSRVVPRFRVVYSSKSLSPKGRWPYIFVLFGRRPRLAIKRHYIGRKHGIYTRLAFGSAAEKPGTEWTPFVRRYTLGPASISLQSIVRVISVVRQTDHRIFLRRSTRQNACVHS